MAIGVAVQSHCAARVNISFRENAFFGAFGEVLTVLSMLLRALFLNACRSIFGVPILDS